MSAQITRDEWLTALHEAGIDAEDDPSALTIMEFGAMFGLRRAASSSRLEKLAESGRAIKTRKRIVRPDGQSLWAVAYRLMPAPKKGARK